MATETLRPNAAGDKTEMDEEEPIGSDHWDVTSDQSDATYLKQINGLDTDLYNLPAHSGSGTINSIKVYTRGYLSSDSGAGESYIVIKTGGTEYKSEAKAWPFGVWTTTDKTWDTNPDTEVAWTWDDIDALQIGVEIQGIGIRWTYCSEVYVEVDYTPVGWQGKISGVSNPAKVMGVDAANIAKVKGVASA